MRDFYNFWSTHEVPTFIWVTRFVELFKILFLAVVTHVLDFVWSFTLWMGFLEQCLPINLSTVLQKGLNDKSGFFFRQCEYHILINSFWVLLKRHWIKISKWFLYTCVKRLVFWEWILIRHYYKLCEVIRTQSCFISWDNVSSDIIVKYVIN